MSRSNRRRCESRPRPVAAILLLVAVFVGACSSESSCGSCRAREVDDVPVRDAAPAPVMVHLKGKTIVSPTGATLADVTICPYPHGEESCVKSGPNGTFDLPLHGLGEVGAIFAAAGYVSVLVPYELGSADVTGVGVSLPISSDRRRAYAGFGLAKLDPHSGFLSAFAAAPTTPLGARGLKMVLDPPSGKGPFYFADDGTVAPTATTTSNFSVGFFAEIPPGTATLTFLGSDGLRCKPTFGGWNAPAPNSVRIPIMAGVETHVTMTCDAPPASDR